MLEVISHSKLVVTRTARGRWIARCGCGRRISIAQEPGYLACAVLDWRRHSSQRELVALAYSPSEARV